VLVTHDAEEAEGARDVSFPTRWAVTGGASSERPVRPQRGVPGSAESGDRTDSRSWLNRIGHTAVDLDPLSVSLHAAFEATIVVAVLGIPLGTSSQGPLPGRGAIETVFSLPMAPHPLSWLVPPHSNGRSGPSAMRRSASSAIPSRSIQRDCCRTDHSNRSRTACASRERRFLRCRPPFEQGARAYGDCPDGGSRSL